MPYFLFLDVFLAALDLLLDLFANLRFAVQDEHSSDRTEHRCLRFHGVDFLVGQLRALDLSFQTFDLPGGLSQRRLNVDHLHLQLTQDLTRSEVEGEGQFLDYFLSFFFARC